MDWPGLMKRATAARYCDMSPAKFERAVSKGELPLPILLNGEERWQRAEIDARTTPSADLGLHDWRKGAKLYAS